MTKTPPHEAVAHLFYQRLIAELKAALQAHHPQLSGHRCSPPSHTGIELLYEGSKETLTIEYPFNLGELPTHLKKLRW